MTKDELFQKVKEVIVDTLSVDENEVTLDASFTDDLDADSLELVDLTMAFESEFGVTIEDDELEKIKTVEIAVNMLAEKLNIDDED